MSTRKDDFFLCWDLKIDFSQYLFIEKVGRDRLGNQSQADCRKPVGAIANLIISMTVFILVFTKCSHLSDSQHKNL